MTDNCDEEWKAGEHGQKEKSKKNSQRKDPKTFKGGGHQAEKRRVKEMVEEVQRARHESVYDENEENQKGEEKQKK